MQQQPSASDGQCLIVAGNGVGLDEFVHHQLYVCQGGRTFSQPYSHLGIYAKQKIHPLVLPIEAEVDDVVLSDFTSPVNLSTQHKLKLDQIRGFLLKRERSCGVRYKVLFLGSPDDPRSIRLPHPIRNDLCGKNGKRTAFTQKHRFISLSQVRAEPQTTSELLGLI